MGADRFRQIHFETDEMGGEDGGGDAYDVDEQEEWAPSRDEFQELVKFREQAAPVLGQLSEYLNAPLDPSLAAQLGQYGQQQEEEEEFDPYDPDSVQRYIGSRVQAGIEEALGPFQNVLGTVAAREGETLARGELDRIEQESGAFDKDTAFLVASGLIEQGTDPRAALEHGATYARGFEERIRADEREKYKKELEQIAGAPRESGTGPASVTEGVPVPTGQDRYRIAVERALGNNHPVYPG